MNEPIRVLIVEDDPASLVLLEYLVNTFSLETVTAVDVAGARRLLAAMTPEIAILGVKLPDGDGNELLAEIRENEVPIAVAMMTATQDSPKPRKCAAWKPDAIFEKSLDAGAIGAWLLQQTARIRPQGRERAAA